MRLTAMRSPTAAVAVALVLGSTAACTTAHQHKGVARPTQLRVSASPSITAGQSVRVVASRAYPPGHPPVPLYLRHAVVLSATSVEFPMGGSGSCPPVATAVQIRGTTVVTTVRPARRGCTFDLLQYAIVMRLSAPIFDPRSSAPITSITVGYYQPRDRLPLSRRQ